MWYVVELFTVNWFKWIYVILQLVLTGTGSIQINYYKNKMYFMKTKKGTFLTYNQQKNLLIFDTDMLND